MSYILDALKKSEQERGQGTIPGVQTVHSSSLKYHQEKRTVWPWFLVALITINLIAILYFIQSKNTEEPITRAQSETISETTALIDNQAKTTAAVSTKNTPVTDSASFSSQPLPVQKEAKAIETQPIEYVEPIVETVDLFDLPLNVRQHVPEMKFSAHVYSSNPLQRSLVINGRFMEEGSQVNNGLILSEITSDGAIFNFQGYRFSTSILSSWN